MNETCTAHETHRVKRAAENGETVSDVIRRALDAYVGVPKSRD